MKIFSLGLFLAITLLSIAQNELDLYRYSKSNIYGDARFEAMGGAFGALGANLSCSQINPAGFGRFSRSFGTGSIGFEGRKQNSLFENGTTEGKNFLTHINNLGFVMVNDESQNNKGWVFGQFGAGLNRLKSFRNTFQYAGNSENSILNAISNQSSGFYPEQLYQNFPFSTSMAWETYAINFDSSKVTYSPVLIGPNQHDRIITEKGGMNELFFSISGNYLKRLYVGANVGLRIVNFSQDIKHTETALNQTSGAIQNFEITDELKVSGAGGNLKLGLIYLPLKQLRLGFSFHSPTFFELEDDYTSNMTTNYSTTTYNLPEAFIPKGNYKYRLRTPSKFIGSAAIIFGSKGCISFDSEIIPYHWSHFRSTTDENFSPYDYNQENKVAKEVFTTGYNFRLGGEYVISNMYFIRAGVGTQSNAFDASTLMEGAWDNTYSFGVGYRANKIAFDLSFSKSTILRNYKAFEGSVANFQTELSRFVISFNYLLE